MTDQSSERIEIFVGDETEELRKMGDQARNRGAIVEPTMLDVQLSLANHNPRIELEGKEVIVGGAKVEQCHSCVVEFALYHGASKVIVDLSQIRLNEEDIGDHCNWSLRRECLQRSLKKEHWEDERLVIVPSKDSEI